jgi:hypothetical protein
VHAITSSSYFSMHIATNERMVEPTSFVHPWCLPRYVLLFDTIIAMLNMSLRALRFALVLTTGSAMVVAFGGGHGSRCSFLICPFLIVVFILLFSTEHCHIIDTVAANKVLKAVTDRLNKWCVKDRSYHLIVVTTSR